LAKRYCRGADRAIIVTAHAISESSGNLGVWFSSLDGHASLGIPTLIAVSKSDLDCMMAVHAAEEMGKRFGVGFHFLSARTGEGNEHLFLVLVAQIIGRLFNSH
jgi:hypothetical protein